MKKTGHYRLLINIGSRCIVWMILLAILLSASTADARVRVDADSSTLRVDSSGILLDEVHPRVQLLIGDDPKLVDFVPTSPAKVSTESAIQFRRSK